MEQSAYSQHINDVLRRLPSLTASLNDYKSVQSKNISLEDWNRLLVRISNAEALLVQLGKDGFVAAVKADLDALGSMLDMVDGSGGFDPAQILSLQAQINALEESLNNLSVAPEQISSQQINTLFTGTAPNTEPHPSTPPEYGVVTAIPVNSILSLFTGMDTSVESEFGYGRVSVDQINNLF